MKPRTKFEKMVAGSVDKLPVLTEYQTKQAIKHCAPHIAKLNSKGIYVCLDCGHTWSGDKSSKVVCPHCGSKLEVKTDRVQNYCERYDFALLQKYNGCQVVRMFRVTTNLRKGEPAKHVISECFQRWIAPDGKFTIAGRRLIFMSRYYDGWNFDSDIEIRGEIYGHTVRPYKIIGRPDIIPELKRNGFTGDLHDCNPNTILQLLLSDNKIETMWKNGYYNLVDYCTKDDFNINLYWPSIKVAFRHHYTISDAGLWIDLIRTLRNMGKDVHNPKFICPDNLDEAHDNWTQKYAAVQNAIWERRRRVQEAEQYAINQKECGEYEEKYAQEKSKYFDLVFTDNELQVKPLVSVREFVEEGHLMHHCVYSCGYYDKTDALIFHAIINGTSVATIEFNISTLEIIQCRGKFNSVPEMKERIEGLIKNNIQKIINKRAA